MTWFKDGKRIYPSQRFIIRQTTNIHTLHIRVALPEDSGDYTVMVENQTGRTTSSARIIVDSVVGFGRRPSYTPRRPSKQIDVATGEKMLGPGFIKIPGDVECREGQLIRFDCRVSGRPYPDVEWYHNDVLVTDDSTHKVAVNEFGVHSLMIFSADVTDEGSYICVARNPMGESSFSVHLTVIRKCLHVCVNYSCLYNKFSRVTFTTKT